MSLQILPHLSNKVIKDIKGFQLDAFLIAYEGWRRGLTLKWYQDESNVCNLSRLNSSTSGKFFSLSTENDTHYFFRSRGDKVGNEDVRLCQNKRKTKIVLEKSNIPVPLGKRFKVSSENEIIKYAEKIGFPVVIKPVNGSMGKGVFINIQNKDELQETLTHYKSHYSYNNCMIEKHYYGKEYRIYVVGDEAVSVINRIPANIVGDGNSTIASLIIEKNNQRKKNPYLAIKPIKVDYEIKKVLGDQGYEESSIPAKNETVFLRELSNLSAGGDPIDETNEISSKIKQIAVDALKALPSIPHGGVDIIVDQDNPDKGVVLEINATAEIAFHSFPLEGNSIDVPAKIIDYYFPETCNTEKANFYFDFQSILEPLVTWSSQVVEVTPSPLGQMYSNTYTVKGKVSKVRYLSWIRRQALIKGLHGTVKFSDTNTVEIQIIGTDKTTVDEFIDICKKGSKNSIVKDVSYVNNEIKSDEFFRLGFEIIRKK